MLNQTSGIPSVPEVFLFGFKSSVVGCHGMVDSSVVTVKIIKNRNPLL